MLMPRSLSTSIDKVAREAVGRDWRFYAALLGHWREIVGADYAEAVTPVKISFPTGKPENPQSREGRRTDGVLHLRLPQGLVLEFSCLQPTILERIATYLGYPAIAKLAFEPFYGATAQKKQGKKTTRHQTVEPATTLPPACEEQIKNIENNELKEQLSSLARHMAADQAQ